MKCVEAQEVDVYTICILCSVAKEECVRSRLNLNHAERNFCPGDTKISRS